MTDWPAPPPTPSHAAPSEPGWAQQPQSPPRVAVHDFDVDDSLAQALKSVGFKDWFKISLKAIPAMWCACLVYTLALAVLAVLGAIAVRAFAEGVFAAAGPAGWF